MEKELEKEKGDEKFELPAQIVIKKGGPNGEDVVLPLEERNGMPIYIKRVVLPYEEYFGLKKKEKKG